MRLHFVLAALAATALAACSNTPAPSQPHTDLQLQPIGNSGVTGTVKMVEHSNGHVGISALVYGLKPNAEHGFHIHENGSCQDNGNAAGAHFNPVHSAHGKYTAPQHHAGDLPSLKADANGVATVNVVTHNVSLTQGAKTIAGRSVIVHANPDDYTTQPNGNAGDRIACAVITAH